MVDLYNSGGKRTVEFKDGSIYTGLINAQGQRDGEGSLIYPDGSRYEGGWTEDLASGKGKVYHSNGDYYEGDWKEGKCHGKGTYVHASGAKYEGDWFDDL